MSRAAFIAFRKSLGRTPALDRMTARVRGLDLAVWTSPPVAGATPLVLVNGGMLYDHALLWPALSPLAAARQVILYDQRGRGESQSPPTPLDARIEDDADDIGALRRALGIRQWDVLGHSWGGGIAMLGVARDLAGTRRLVTVDAVGPTSAWMPELHATTLARVGDAERATLESIFPAGLHDPDPSVHGAHARAAYPAWFADADFATFFAPPDATSITGAAVAARLRREGYDWRERLRALSTPTLVLHGEQDALPVAAAHQLAALLPHARLALIPDAGHMPFWESPAHFFDLVETFLVTGTTGPPRRP
ncbi:MAG: alpha/beta hydrolase [Gemmatimonadaceae bacterium]